MSARQVVIALGTNLGDRGRNAWWAVQQLIQHDIKVLRCSGLYETRAAYVQAQPAFLNAAVLASTPLAPRDLLHTLKSIESAAGRDVAGGVRWGPRPLDLDIIFTADQPYIDDKLTIPHPRWREREFVLRPLSDLWYRSYDSPTTPTASTSAQTDPSTHAAPHTQLDPSLRPHIHEAYAWAEAQSSQHCSQQTSQQQSTAHSEPAGAGTGAVTVGDVMRRVTPAGRGGGLITWGERTLVMGILNVTPDSFSDGGQFMASLQASTVTTASSTATEAPSSTANSTVESAIGSYQGSVDIEAIVRTARQMAVDGADILDVGGQSTRPGATLLTPQQELSRVIPVIRALRRCPDLDNVLISIDTFYAEVARHAVEAGADIVNDVSGGTLDTDMTRQVAALGVPYILMHMRGQPANMHHAQHTQYTDVVEDVGRELQQRVDAAVAAGIPAWNIITDPGIGFAKTAQGNIELLRGLRTPLRDSVLQGAVRHGPMLMGPSRKGFLGKLTGRQTARERDAATVAAVVACVEQGADIVRVHNVRDCVDGVKVADAVYRN